MEDAETERRDSEAATGVGSPAVRRDAVIVVSSHVARGAVGNRAAVFALETLGFPVWAVPTVMLPWHPGHGRATRIVPSAEQFSAFLGDLENAPWLGEVAAVLSGYLGNAGQAEAVASLVRAVKRRNPGALYLCDPVMGDIGGLYVPEAVAAAFRDALVPLADIATPNRFELEWLAGRTLNDLDSAAEAAAEAAPPMTLVTSAPGLAAGTAGSLLVTASGALLAEHAAVEHPPKGVGDLTAALFLARLLAGEKNAEALRLATASTLDVLARAVERGADELMLAADGTSLLHPLASVSLRPLAFQPRRQTA